MKFQLTQDVVLPDGRVGKVEKIKNGFTYVNGNPYHESNLQPYIFKKGDRVVTKKFETGEHGGMIFRPEMYPFVDKEGEIDVAYSDKAGVHDWYWPVSAIRLAPSEPEKWEPKHLEEVEVNQIHDKWTVCKFLAFNSSGKAVVEYFNGSSGTFNLEHIRPIPPDPDAELKQRITACEGDVSKLVELFKTVNIK